MSISQALDPVVYTVAVVGLIWMLVPGVMKTLNLFFVSSTVHEDPELAQPTAGDDSYRRGFEQLLARGFRPVGMTRETAWFHTPFRWRRRSLQGQRCLLSPDGRVLLAFYRLIPEEPVRFSAITLLEGGGLVRTACPGAGVARDASARHRRVELKGVEPAEILALHDDAVASFCRERNLTRRPITLRDLAVEGSRESRLILAQQSTRNFWALVAAVSIVPALGFLLLLLFAPGRAQLRLHDLAFSLAAAVAGYAIVRDHVVGVGLREAVLRSHARTERR
jgi:hypothetical protein